MAYGNWDEIIGEYVKLYLPSRFSEHARGMLDLIPRLRQEPTLSDLIPITSHGTLILKYPDIKTGINIWCEKPGEAFRISLYDGHETAKEVVVSNDEIITVVQQYAEKLRARAGSLENR